MSKRTRPYEPPEVVIYGRLVGLTKGFDFQNCVRGEKSVGAGDDMAEAEQSLSAWICVDPAP